MSFFASNNRIYITNNSGKVIFDTDKPMPHIIQEVTKTVTVAFPDVDTNYWENIAWQQQSIYCPRQEYQCGNVYECGYETVCKLEWVPNPSHPSGGQFENVCRQEYVCKWVNRCQWVTVNDSYWLKHQGYDYLAKNWSVTHDLVAVRDRLDADFLLVNASIVRNKQGTLADIGPIPCGLPIGPTFIANNTSIIETSSDIRDGTPWLTRIMSVFVAGGTVVAEFKHSNRAFKSVSEWVASGCLWNDIPAILPDMPREKPVGGSTYTVTFNIQIGKFTI